VAFADVETFPAEEKERKGESMSTARSIKLVLCLLAATAGLTLATAGKARAGSPITGTDVSTFSDSFSGSLDCRDEPYAFTVTGHTVMHFTYLAETGALHFHLVDHGKAVAVPVDGTGPSYAASFFDFDLENIRAIAHGDALVEEDTDLFRTVMNGSDGSRSFFYFHEHFTMNASGETTVHFEMDRMLCT
jgi:hypothetical protein